MSILPVYSFTATPIIPEKIHGDIKLGWGTRDLLDGRKLPEIADGSWHSKENAEVEIVQALRAGFHHIDTAQIYRNEAGVGRALSQFDRSSYWITSKWSGMDSAGIQSSIADTLDLLKLDSIDLYLVHSPRLVELEGGPIPTWKKMIQTKIDGKTKSIGVSNYKILDLEIIRKSGLELPVVNQILLHPYVYEETRELLAYHQKHGIVTEAYSVLTPITSRPGGAVDPKVALIAEREGVTPGEVLLAWARSKEAVVITASSSSARLETYLRAGRLQLSPADIHSIDVAGAKKSTVWRVARVALHSAAAINAGYFLAKWYNLI